MNRKIFYPCFVVFCLVMVVVVTLTNIPERIAISYYLAGHQRAVQSYFQSNPATTQYTP